MRIIEAGLFPVIPYLHLKDDMREVMSMSDYAYGDRAKAHGENKTIESHAVFGACYVAFLLRAALSRLTPWRKRAVFDHSRNRESIFAEARSAAGTIVTSSFMGL
ncbi:hypothetical protein [Bradyrhizobium japonicum]|jgi:hypothetical protein|uniref:hypothetical protein n=1 Tax=Bradyrhizobium japonicum TaxID=375 RepID=UPI0020113D21|nr:hypothetical protein [Bradyrhizobium japonicum]